MWAMCPAHCVCDCMSRVLTIVKASAIIKSTYKYSSTAKISALISIHEEKRLERSQAISAKVSKPNRMELT